MSSEETKSKKTATNRRSRKTQDSLISALVTLMQEKPLTDISIKEITALADVNRGTFYLHYKDVYDLAEQCELKLIGKIEAVFDGDSSGEDFLNNPEVSLERLYAICKKDAAFIKVLLGSNGDIRFLNSLNKFLKERFIKDWAPLHKGEDAKYLNAYYTFLVGGSVCLLQYWFNTGLEMSPKELAHITVRFIKQIVETK